ncbi:MAG: chlorite dismutase family protein [Acidobacteria bacterium]|nr:chlorite dismutase family protein [Acidobacteriota bacterium]
MNGDDVLPIELVNSQKETADAGGLRLVEDVAEPRPFPVIESQFVNFMLLRVDKDWRRLDDDTKREYKAEFTEVFDRFRGEMLMFSYSLVGFDSKADLMFWRISNSLDVIQEMTSALFHTRFGSYLETADNYLASTKRMMFVSDSSEDRFYVNAGERMYHFLYPCVKNSQWREKTIDERDALMEENFMIGKKFPNIRIHLTHAFGFGEQDYIISFETDEPRDFLNLADELARTTASKFTMRGTPIYTCRQRSLSECLDALG